MDMHIRTTTPSLYVIFATLVKILPAVLLCAGLGSAYGEIENPEFNEVALWCPLTADVNSTKQGVLVVHFDQPKNGNPEDVMGCSWLREDPDNPHCDTQGDFRLVGLHKNRVVVKGPRTAFRTDGSYYCQLIPPDEDQPFTMCIALDGEEELAGKASPPPEKLVAESTSITTTTTTKGPEALEKNEPASTVSDSTSGLVAAVVALTFITLTLLVLVIVLTALHVYCRTDLLLLGKQKTGQPKEETSPLNRRDTFETEVSDVNLSYSESQPMNICNGKLGNGHLGNGHLGNGHLVA